MGSLELRIPSGIAKAARKKKADDFLAGNDTRATYNLVRAERLCMQSKGSEWVGAALIAY